ncbi:MAG: PEGA domain-containing protein [Planctomycetota bacterium]|nr:PEGA domain-containing protein [Planctomycetota bacterium]
MKSRFGTAASRWIASLVLTAAVLITAGCVRRTARFTSVPDGARVFLNDREIGRTPATVEFTWYGDYDVVYRLDGYETVKTNAVISPPLYQRFPFDFFAEVLWPGELHDHHDIPTQELVARRPINQDELISRAKELRDRALVGSEESDG